MFSNISEFFLFLISLSVILLAVIWNYKVFLKIYAFQVLLIISVFYYMYWNLFSEDIFLFLSFLFAIAVRLILIPWVLYKFINSSKVPIVEREFKFWIFVNLIIYLASLVLLYNISIKIYWEIQPIFIWATFMVISWFLNFANHKKLIWDILSFLEIENWVFLLSLLALDKISIYLELWIVVDIVMSLAILIIMTLKIKNIYWSIDIDKISSLKD